MKVQVIATTDNKHLGEVHEVPLISREIMANFGIDASSIKWIGTLCIVQSSNYTIKLKKIGE